MACNNGSDSGLHSMGDTENLNLTEVDIEESDIMHEINEIESKTNSADSEQIIDMDDLADLIDDFDHMVKIISVTKITPQNHEFVLQDMIQGTEHIVISQPDILMCMVMSQLDQDIRTSVDSRRLFISAMTINCDDFVSAMKDFKIEFGLKYRNGLLEFDRISRYSDLAKVPDILKKLVKIL